MDTDYFDFDANPELSEYFMGIFKQFDKTNEGTISIDDLGTALRLCGMAPSMEDIKLWQEAHDDGSGRLPSDAFLEVVKKCVSEFKGLEALKDAFRSLDPMFRGFLTPHDLRYFLTSFGEKMTDEEASEFLADAIALGDVDSEGNVNYEGFAAKLLPDFLTL
eukprot:PhM_4_TR10793/c0_g1_i1/m.48952/K02183/CALM; calmodulin